jgi:hypothetical protein
MQLVGMKMGKMLTCLSISAIFKTLNFMHICVKGLFCIPAQAVVILCKWVATKVLCSLYLNTSLIATEITLVSYVYKTVPVSEWFWFTTVSNILYLCSSRVLASV